MAKRSMWRRLLVTLALGGLSGCTSMLALPDSLAALDGGAEARRQADVQVAMGRTLEKQDPARALAAYGDALKRDPSRSDAALHAAALLDQQGKFADSVQYYRKAEAADPGSAKVACNRGYSLYLQGRWSEAEASLRQALARQPDLRPAHNNLGLVLARSGRPDEALGEFHKAGLDEADARVNLAFALTLQEHWAEAKAQYAQALIADPSSVPAKHGLAELNELLARHDRPVAPATEQAAGGDEAASNERTSERTSN